MHPVEIPPENGQEPMPWYCVRSQPKREHLAATALRKQHEIECFAPRLRARKLTRRGPVWFVEAMFPCYLFAKFDHALQRRMVEHAPGISGLVRFGDRLATIDPSTIEMLRNRVEADDVVTVDPELQVGHEVQISQGPFQGLEALVTHLIPATERVRVLLDFLGRSVQTEVSKEKLIQRRLPPVL